MANHMKFNQIWNPQDRKLCWDLREREFWQIKSNRELMWFDVKGYSLIKIDSTHAICISVGN